MAYNRMMIVTGARAGRGRRIAAGGIAAAVLLLPAVLLAQVDTAWVRRYDGPRHGEDWATAIAVDSAGNVYVTGTSAFDTGYVNLDWVTIKYRPNGDTAWVKRRDFGGTDQPAAIGVDSRGNVYVAGEGNNRFVTISYDSVGRLRWSWPYGIQGWAAGLVLDAGGNIFAGGALDDGGDYRSAIVKYRANGDTAWARVLSAGGGCKAEAVSLGQGYGIVAACERIDAVRGTDYLTVVYDSVGRHLWQTAYSGPADYDRPSDVAIDATGHVIVTGSSEGLTSPWDYLTIKYSPDGETLWTRRYNGTANDWDEPRGLAVDSAGNVYVTGESYVTSSSPSVATLKYAPDGTLRWTALYGGTIANYGKGRAIALDRTGGVYVCGISAFTPGAYGDYVTIKYNPDGDTVWVRSYNGTASDIDEAMAMAVDDHGGVYVTGQSYGVGSGPDIVTIKYVQPGAVAEPSEPSAARPTDALSVVPNPCRTHAIVRWQPQGGGPARVSILDALGRPVRVLLDGSAAAGEILWDRTDAAGERVPAGVYFVELVTGGSSLRAKLLVID